MRTGLEVVIVQHADKQPQPGDPGLTTLGREQAALTARWLAAHLELAALWSSPLRRAMETSAPIAHAARLPITTDDRLRERMNWDNPDVQSLQQFLDEWTAATHDRDLLPASGDSSNRAAHRFLDFLEDLANRHQRGTHAIVSHGGITVDLLRTLIGDDALSARWPQLIDHGMPNCGLTRLSLGNDWAIETAAWTEHLKPPGS